MLHGVKKNILTGFLLFLVMAVIPFLSWGVNVECQAGAGGLKIPEKYNDEGLFFCFLDESTGKILKISDREFLYGAVAAEMPAVFEEEALKAQAVACYTYFCRLRNDFLKKEIKDKNYEFTVNTEKGLGYVCETQTKMKWGSDFEKYDRKIKNAVDSVFGEVVKEKGDLIFAAYHAISSGKTEKSSDVFGGELKYLTNVESPGDKFVSGYETTVKISCSDFQKMLTKEYSDCNFNGLKSLWVGETERTAAGMVKEIVLCGHKARGTDIRKIFNLRSSDFDLEYDSLQDEFIFTVRGYGHGVGMSQHGARYMAQNGADYKKILEWYYPGCSIAYFKSIDK